MTINDNGVEILNNKSKVIDNTVEKSHENGIRIIGYDKNTRSTPQIWKNTIFSCGQQGILCLGEFCEPDIRGNIIGSNRRAGIKLSEFACASIGGTTQDDNQVIPKLLKEIMKEEKQAQEAGGLIQESMKRTQMMNNLKQQKMTSENVAETNHNLLQMSTNMGKKEQQKDQSFLNKSQAKIPQ